MTKGWSSCVSACGIRAEKLGSSSKFPSTHSLHHSFEKVNALPLPFETTTPASARPLTSMG